jgi:Predicted transcriptional regulators
MGEVFMRYSISQAAEKAGMTAPTLRFYDKEGLLPFVERDQYGSRSFKESDFEWLSIINILKNTGMSIKDIKIYIDWCMDGDYTLENRFELFKKQKELVQSQIDELQKYMDKINYKFWYYETALAAGTESIHTMEQCISQKKTTEEEERA